MNHMPEFAPEPATVKICGIRSTDTLAGMKGLDVDHIGFVFASSKRRVTPKEAGSLIRYLKDNGYQAAGMDGKPKFRAAGVFVNPTMEELEAVMTEAPLDIIQLHGDESPDFCQRVKEALPVELFKAIPIRRTDEEGSSAHQAESAEELIARMQPYADAKAIDAYLLDTFDPVHGGGSGRTFPWSVIEPLQTWARASGSRLIVAGGLHAENVEGLIQTYRPDGIDVSSGVETDGVKDIIKIQAFVERVKRS